MNYLDALRSGKWFRRKEQGLNWYGVVDNRVVYQPGLGAEARSATIAVTDLTAADWEIKEEPIYLTKQQFIEKYSESLRLLYADRGVIYNWNLETDRAHSKVIQNLIIELFGPDVQK